MKHYQEALAGHGYYSDPIDGVYGATTRAALTACIQAGCRLVDGVPETPPQR